jgi:hypothetical protein
MFEFPDFCETGRAYQWGGEFLGFWTSWSEICWKLDSLEIKSRAESFSMEIPGNLLNRITCVGTV